MGRRHAFAFLILIPSVMAAQSPARVDLSYYLPSAVSYDPAVPTPESFFGFQVGEWHLQPDQIHAYIKELGRISERISIEPMGRSHEEREILLAVITAPSNHARLTAIRDEHLALSQPERSGGMNIGGMPVVVWMGYSVHGNEASGSNASVLVAYYLAAAKGPEIDSALQRAVVLLNPSINPDGLNRFSSWVNANRGMTIDTSPASREHNEPWPGGRTNHYWFDLNRDWMPLQHPESRARIAQYYAWRPNVLTDHHEMGSSSTFFFQPGIPSRNNPLVPSSVGDLTAKIGEFHARALDSIGSLYYSGESFDDFYIGKGSSYPDITGGVGILFEQASARGHAQKTRGGVLTFPFAIRNQVTTSLSTFRAAVQLRSELLEHQRTMAESAMDLASRSRTKAYLFGTGVDAARTQALAKVLHGHTIGVYELGREVKAGGRVFRPGEAFVVPVQQVQYRLITSLFERRTSFDDSLFYDVSAWSLPIAFGLPHTELGSAGDGLLGARFDPDRLAAPDAMPNDAPVYAFSWSAFYAPRAIEKLFAGGIVPRIALEGFTALTADGKRSFERGAVLIPMGAQPVAPGKVMEVLRELNGKDGIVIHGLTSGQTPDGIDLGSPTIDVLERPRIALLAGDGVSPTDAGEIWHLLDHRHGLTVTLLDPKIVRRSILAEFNVVIMPAGGYGQIDSHQASDLTTWVRDGNTLIALEQAVAWAVKNKLTSIQLTASAANKGDTTTQILYEQETKVQGARRVPGAIVAATADLSHPLFFGVDAVSLHLFKSTPYSFVPSHRRALTPVVYDTNPLVSGYLHQRTIDQIKGEAAMAITPLGRGRVVLLADNPTFRAYWYGSSRILTNAVFLGPSMRVPSSEE